MVNWTEEECHEIKTMVYDVHKAIVGSIDGKPGMLERMRDLEKFQSSVQSMTRKAVGLLITNGCLFVTNIVLFFIKAKVGAA